MRLDTLDMLDMSKTCRTGQAGQRLDRTWTSPLRDVLSVQLSKPRTLARKNRMEGASAPAFLPFLEVLGALHGTGRGARASERPAPSHAPAFAPAPIVARMVSR